ncbi:hypothetical protein FLM48_15710 [Shewanella sp. Scap07]|nr:hypothetical protein FLM48_15710 [Shewanella sp. Scap07]
MPGCSKYIASYTNQYKHLVTQREFSGSEARSLNAPALMTFTTSMWFATSEEHSYSTVKLVNTASEALKLAILARFWLPTSALNNLTREQPLFQYSL